MGLFGRDELAEDARLRIDGRFSGIAIAINQRTEAEVDAVLNQAGAAGATILKPAEKAFWGGYSGYFADLDGHVWECAQSCVDDRRRRNADHLVAVGSSPQRGVGRHDVSQLVDGQYQEQQRAQRHQRVR